MRKPDWGQGKVNLCLKVFLIREFGFLWKTAFLLRDLCVGPVEALKVSMLARFYEHDRSVLI
jgi:hypothetical protein